MKNAFSYINFIARNEQHFVLVWLCPGETSVLIHLNCRVEALEFGAGLFV